MRVDCSEIEERFAGALVELDAAMDFGRTVGQDVERIYMVACGSANRSMLGLKYWIEHFSPSIEVRRYFPAEFMTQNPPRLDDRTLVLLASKSGTTPETVAAAEFLRDRECRVVAFTQLGDKPLGRAVAERFTVGESSESFAALSMLMLSVVGGILVARDGWPHGEALLSSLRRLPGAIAQAASVNDGRAAEEARLYANDRVLYHVAAGPCFTTAYVFGVCMLMEMLWLHSYPIEAAEFFHGPFEIVDERTPILLILGEDPSRPLMERVRRFCERFAPRRIIYDSRDFAMPGVDPVIRPLVAPYVLQAALKRLAAHLSVRHNQPLSTRRYMWKTEY